jgi:hypothetical protein
MKKLLLLIPLLLACSGNKTVKVTLPELQADWSYIYEDGNKGCLLFIRDTIYSISLFNPEGMWYRECGSYKFRNDSLFLKTDDGNKSQYSDMEVYFTDESKKTLHVGTLGDFQHVE